ncbi:hypothetical protein F6Y05_32810 [Bacillus megaterium]|nr:hypothetical protein [Priestia megaterium]
MEGSINVKVKTLDADIALNIQVAIQVLIAIFVFLARNYELFLTL